MKITKSIQEETTDDKQMNIIEGNYKKLKCDVTPCAKNGETWKVVDKFLQTSNPSGHRMYNIKLENLYELDRDGE